MNPASLANLFQTDTLADMLIHHRIADAAQRLDEATNPLHATSYTNDTTTGHNAHADPVADLAIQHHQHGDPTTQTRQQLDTLIKQRHHISITIAAIINTWAPRQAPGNDRPTPTLTIWCANHLANGGGMEPRGNDGSRYCTWCRDIRHRYGKLPTKELIALKAKRGRIDDGTYRKLLGKTKIA